MTSYAPAKKNTAYILFLGLPSRADPAIFKDTPTLASGDFKVSIDGGALANLATLPTNTPGGKMVKVSLSSTEMNGDNITVVCSDAAGAEWCDVIANIPTAVRQVDDLAFPLTSGRGTLVDASGNENANLVNIAGVAVSTTTAQLGVNAVQAGATAWNSGAIKTTSFTAGAIDAAAIAADAIGASELATDAVTEIVTAVWAATTRILTAGTNIALAKGTGVTGFNDLDAAAVRAATGLASANLDTQLAAIAGYIDTEVAAIKAKTDLIPGTMDGKTFEQVVKLIAAVLLGKASGMATTTAVFRAIDDGKDRVTATVDADGNRSAVTLDAS